MKRGSDTHKHQPTRTAIQSKRQSRSLSLGAVSNSDVGGHGSPLFPVSCSFDDLDFTDFQQLAALFMKFSRGLPLLLSPSIFPVTTMFSSPCFLMICPRKLICPALILFINFLSVLPLLNTSSFVTWSFQDMCSILL